MIQMGLSPVSSFMRDHRLNTVLKKDLQPDYEGFRSNRDILVPWSD